MFRKILTSGLRSKASIVRSQSQKVATTVEHELVHPTGVLPITNRMNIVDTLQLEKWPIFRVLGPDGKLVEGAETPNIGKEEAQKMYQAMIRIQTFDDIFYNAQRQGRISFYMQNNGEEAIHIGERMSYLNNF